MEVNLMKKILLLSTLALCWNAPAQLTGISGERMRAHVKYLASDLLEGRGVGSRGGDLATEYIERHCKKKKKSWKQDVY